MDASARSLSLNTAVVGNGFAIDEEEFWPLRKVLKQVGIGRAKVYQMIKEGRFPRPVKVDTRSFWRKSEITAWKHDIIERAREQGQQSGWMTIGKKK